MTMNSLHHSLLALVEVHYKRDVPERYEMVMAPVGDGTLVCVGMHSPYAGENRERMHPWPSEQYDSEALRAVHVMVDCLFGDIRAAPRIVGAPDWSKVSLEVLALGGRKPRRLMQLELSADSTARGTCLHWDTTAVVGHEAVRLCPEDADPLYAVTRLAMADWVPMSLPDAARAPVSRQAALSTHDALHRPTDTEEALEHSMSDATGAQPQSGPGLPASYAGH